MNLFIISVTLFALAALLGVFLLSKILGNKETPKGISITHGILASIALFLLIAHAINNNREDLIFFIILFIAAAMGGLVLIYRDLSGKYIPKSLALLHGVLALSAFVTLVLQ